MIGLFVSGRSVWDYQSRQAISGGAHGERLKDALIQKFPVRFATIIFNDEPQQVVAAVTVIERLARRKFQWVRRQRRYKLPLSQVPSQLEAIQACVTFDPRSVRQEVAYGNVSPRFGNMLEVLAYLIVN